MTNPLELLNLRNLDIYDLISINLHKSLNVNLLICRSYEMIHRISNFVTKFFKLAIHMFVFMANPLEL